MSVLQCVANFGNGALGAVKHKCKWPGNARPSFLRFRVDLLRAPSSGRPRGRCAPTRSRRPFPAHGQSEENSMDAVRASCTLSRLPPALARLWTLILDTARAVKIRRRERSLRVCETLSLGERRFLMVVQFEEQRFLIGTTSQSISLLQRMDECAASSPGPEDSVPGNSLRNGSH